MIACSFVKKHIIQRSHNRSIRPSSAWIWLPAATTSPAASKPKQQDQPLLFTTSDSDIIHQLETYPYKLQALLVICLPTLVSLAFMPVALLLHKPLMNFFWPAEIFPTPPKINDVISCFLIPAGLVYAIAFGFAFQEASSQQISYRKWIASYSTVIKQILLILKHLKGTPLQYKLTIIRQVKCGFISCSQHIMKMENDHETIGQ